MSDLAETASPALPESPPENPPSADARAARLARFERERLIVDYLNRGVPVAEIAARLGIGEKRTRAPHAGPAGRIRRGPSQPAPRGAARSL